MRKIRRTKKRNSIKSRIIRALAKNTKGGKGKIKNRSAYKKLKSKSKITIKHIKSKRISKLRTGLKELKRTKGDRRKLKKPYRTKTKKLTIKQIAIKQYKTIDKKTRRKLGINKKNFLKEFSKEYKEIKKQRKLKNLIEL